MCLSRSFRRGGSMCWRIKCDDQEDRWQFPGGTSCSTARVASSFDSNSNGMRCWHVGPGQTSSHLLMRCAFHVLCVRQQMCALTGTAPAGRAFELLMSESQRGPLLFFEFAHRARP